MAGSSNTLSILALKVAPNVFDISSGLFHISIRDQMLRARTLVRDLDKGNQLVLPAAHVLIVGAGVAGVSAAMALGELVVETVVVDSAAEPFSVQKNVTSRFVGPYMYEWPSDFFDDQAFPPVSPSSLNGWASLAGQKSEFLSNHSSSPVTASDAAMSKSV